MDVLAKFRCDSIKHTANGSEIELAAVGGNSPENEKFFKWTPCATIKLAIVNHETASVFIPGQEYYVNFSPADNQDPRI